MEGFLVRRDRTTQQEEKGKRYVRRGPLIFSPPPPQRDRSFYFIILHRGRRQLRRSAGIVETVACHSPAATRPNVVREYAGRQDPHHARPDRFRERILARRHRRPQSLRGLDGQPQIWIRQVCLSGGSHVPRLPPDGGILCDRRRQGPHPAVVLSARDDRHHRHHYRSSSSSSGSETASGEARADVDASLARARGLRAHVHSQRGVPAERRRGVCPGDVANPLGKEGIRSPSGCAYRQRGRLTDARWRGGLSARLSRWKFCLHKFHEPENIPVVLWHKVRRVPFLFS